MWKFILLLGFAGSLIFCDNQLNVPPLKVLHISFHQGCINDFQEVANQLGLNLTSWYALSGKFDRELDEESVGNAIYNIGHDKAKRIWEKHKNYFDQFDVVVVSDTAPLSRIFLQNGWEKPLIIWICNRFDYYDGASLDCEFPDGEYYQLFNAATQKSNVKIISYTPYEYIYAKQRGIYLDQSVIKPVGSPRIVADELFASAIPEYIDKENTLLLFPRLDPNQKDFIENKCKELDISIYSGQYNGPQDLLDFKGVLFFPYAWSNLTLFEDLSLGIIHFVPSLSFLKELAEYDAPVPYPGFSKRFVDLEYASVCEWYCSEYHDALVYFDSWDDLKLKLDCINREEMRKVIKSVGLEHNEEMIERWKKIINLNIFFY